MKAKIVRLEQSEQGALGILLFDGVIFCFTLCPDINDTKKFYVPEGVYICKRFHGTKWPNTFEMVEIGRADIDGHTALVFHAGNDEGDTLGCTILGETTGKLKGERAVLNSGATFKRFLDYTKNVNEFSLEIVDCY